MYNYLLNIKYRNYVFVFLLPIIILILVILSSFIKVYDYTKCYAIYSENYFMVNVPFLNSDSVMNGKYLTLNNNRYHYKVSEVSDLIVVENQNYQQIKIKIDDMDNEYLSNQIVEITFYYNRKTILQKILKLLY